LSDQQTLKYVLTYGACRGMDTALFFPSDPEQEPPGVCWGCPVQDECREWGLEHEENGCWGGHSQAELARIRLIGGITVEPIPGSQPHSR
jgi:Transcription factor WhiB